MFFILDKLMYMIIRFILITKQFICVDNVRRTYILMNSLGLKRLIHLFPLHLPFCAAGVGINCSTTEGPWYRGRVSVLLQYLGCLPPVQPENAHDPLWPGLKGPWAPQRSRAGAAAFIASPRDQSEHGDR